MAGNYYPEISSHQKQNSDYPDIDENVQYPWQHGQPVDDGNALSSVLDPRLFGDHPQPFESVSQPPAEVEPGVEEEEESSSGEYEQQYPPVPFVPGQFDGAASDNDFVMSGEEETDRYFGRNFLSTLS
jgi:general transcription factor 3C polypeptide 3 (transcription factor C subunit 4)